MHSLDITKSARVSVVLCTYNGESFIKEQLLSILNQTYPLHEIIIVDDCSTDNTVLIIESLASESNIVKVYKNESNIGYNKNFEKALQLTSADIIAISDQDDVWHTQKIEILLEQWKENTLLIYCDSVRFDKEIPEYPKSSRIVRRVEGKNPRKLSVYNTVPGHAMLIKKELLSLSLPFNNNIYYDWWLAMVATCNGGISYNPSVLVYQRVHDNNVTIKNNLSNTERLLQYKIMLLDHLMGFQEIKNLDQENLLFFKRLFLLWKRSLLKRFNWKLFLFLMKYRNDIYYYKVRKVGLFSHLKHSCRYSFKNGSPI